MIKKPSYLGLTAAVFSICLWSIFMFFNPYSNEANYGTAVMFLKQVWNEKDVQFFNKESTFLMVTNKL